ncbi:sperm acrosome-associated protein 5-like [Microtus pennsylvanicus]|uniref:sperm acrosome-associated protein 5-like n=1 Tax=Microtus pennsylvanicus TaxID=10058 RepID=UPI003F6C327E
MSELRRTLPSGNVRALPSGDVRALPSGNVRALPSGDGDYAFGRICGRGITVWTFGGSAAGGSRFWPDLRQGDHAFGRICGRGMPTRAAALALWAALTVAAADAKIYGRCELAGNLVRAGLDGFGGFAVGDWLCVAHAESGFDTASVGHHPDGSGAYGLFGLSSAWWCHDGVTPTHDLCHLRCDDLLNRHLLDDIACIKKVVTLHRSMDAWNSWSRRCKGHDPSLWLRGCALRPRDPWPR